MTTTIQGDKKQGQGQKSDNEKDDDKMRVQKAQELTMETKRACTQQERSSRTARWNLNFGSTKMSHRMIMLKGIWCGKATKNRFRNIAQISKYLSVVKARINFHPAFPVTEEV
uniref:Uncharacterized protein n=1 Tax=Romanomermis culicivorax TaxID=13658 RepID=A0A915IR77_ROMCU